MKLANIKSAQKRIKITANKTDKNRSIKTEIKTYVKRFEAAVENNNFDEAKELLNLVDKKLKRASQKNIIHKNTASRKVSRLTKKMNKAM